MRRAASLLAWLALVALPPAPAVAEPAPVRHAEQERPWLEPSWDLFGLDGGALRLPSHAKAPAEESFPWLPDERHGRSFSVGTVTDGYLVGGAMLPLPARTHAVLPRQFHRRLLWGTEEMIALIEHVSEEVDRAFPGSVLWLGNLGRRGGGDIPWSVSHNAGRDADLAFYTLDPAGRPVEPPDLLRYGADGRSMEFGGYYRFDVPRNWALVRAFVTSDIAQVQYLFISNPLRDLLLRHARVTGEPEEVVARAARLLRQPGPEIPHDDHLHLRVYCSRADAGAGCEHLGAVHPGVDLFRGAREERVASSIGWLRHDDPHVRAMAARRLGHLGATSAADAVLRRLSDPVPVVRQEAVRVLARLGGPSHASRLVEHWEDEHDRAVRADIVRTLLRIGDRPTADFLAFLVSSPTRVEEQGKEVRAALLVADGAADAGRWDLVGPLVDHAGTPDRVLRQRIWTALEELACRASDPDAHDGGWNAWYDVARASGPIQWRTDGLAAAGIALPVDGRERAAELAQAAGDERRWVRVNAQRWLMEMTGNQPASLRWSRHDARTYWRRWVRRNPGRIARR